MNEKNNITKTAMITVCGRPNVGKSSLTNALVGEKIAIVSNKPQTTRNRIYGVVNRGDTQFILLDTPGLHKARSRLGDYMVKVVRESLDSVEAALLLVEPICPSCLTTVPQAALSRLCTARCLQSWPSPAPERTTRTGFPPGKSATHWNGGIFRFTSPVMKAKSPSIGT